MFRQLTSALAFIFAVTYANGGLANSSDNSLSHQNNMLTRDSIVVGRVSTNPKKHFKHLKPIADYLADNLSDFGITEGKVLFAKDNQQMIRFIQQGKVDLITETVFSATEFQNKAGAEIVLRRWKKGVADYSSIMFAKKESGITSLDGLVGKTIAFQDMGSSSSFFIPASILIQNGYQLVRLDSPREVAPEHAIGYVFANKELNISAWVNKGIVDAGALSNLDWNNEEDMPESFRQVNNIIYQSIPFPRGVELLRADMDPALKTQIVQILLNAHENEQGKRVLKAYQKTLKFDELFDSSDSVRRAKELAQIVAEQL